MAETPLTPNTETEATIPLPKKLEVVPNWRHVLRTYSFWTNVASVILTFIEQILPFFGLLEPTMSVTTYGVVMFCLNVSAVVFRMIKQKRFWEQPQDVQ